MFECVLIFFCSGLMFCFGKKYVFTLSVSQKQGEKFLYCSFEGRADMHLWIHPNWQNLLCFWLVASKDNVGNQELMSYGQNNKKHFDIRNVKLLLSGMNVPINKIQLNYIICNENVLQIDSGTWIVWVQWVQLQPQILRKVHFVLLIIIQKSL